MKIALFYYDEFAEFEIVLVGLLFHNKHDIISIALENREYRSEECQRFCVDKVVKDVDADSIDLLVIPGGDPAPLVGNRELKSFIQELVSRNKKVGGICGGSGLLAGLGVLEGKKCTGGTSGVKPGDAEYKYYSGAILSDEYVVVDGNIITAQGQAYAEFAVELARQMGVIKNDKEYDECLRNCQRITSDFQTGTRQAVGRMV
jgi:4-methyl-5(b-hydroxyethyl)-thiazole monophosphate biosynthesis